MKDAPKNPLPASLFLSPVMGYSKELETLAGIFRKSTAAQLTDGTSMRVPKRDRNLESVNRKGYGRRMTERLLPTHRYPTYHQEMNFRSLVMTEAYI